MRMVAYKRKAAKYFNRKETKDFQLGDLVLREIAAVGHPLSKFRPNWEVPYEVICSLGKGAYSLKHLRGKPLGSQ